MKSLPRDNAHSSRRADWSMDAQDWGGNLAMLVCLPADTHLEERIERGQRKEAFEECHHALQGIIDGVHRRAEEQLQHGLRVLARVIIRTHL